MKVAFLTNIVSPYRKPVFESLASTPEWDLTVVVNARTEFDRGWDDDSHEGLAVVQSKSLAWKRKHVSHEPVRAEQVITRYLPVGLWRDLDRLDPDVVITQELGPRSLIASTWARLNGRPLVVWSYQSRAGATTRGRLRGIVRNIVLGRAASVVGMGIQAREVLIGFGVPSQKIVDAPNACHQEVLLARLEQSRADGTIERLRAEIGQGRRIALIPGRMVPYKGIREFVALWRSLPAALRDPWTLLFVGDGPLAQLVDASALAGIQRRATVPMAEVADYYGIADLLVFPTLADVWGLVVNEAMLCGVPCLCSVHAGCFEDMIVDGRNGLSFDPTDEGLATDRLCDALTREDLAELGARAVERSAEFTIERLADGFRGAVGSALQTARDA